MIKSLKTEKLFGRFDYDFQTKEGGVTIVTGPNGFGKSTILQIINAIGNRKIAYFLGLEFRVIKSTFDNGESVTIEKKDDEISINGVHLSLKLIDRLNYHSKYPIVLKEFFNFNEIEVNYEDNLEKLNDILNSMSNWSGKTRLISDQRLIRRTSKGHEEEDPTESVLELPNSLKKIIDEVSSDYSTQANKLDSTYPRRLLTSKDKIDKATYQDSLHEARKKFLKLKEYNLAEMSLFEDSAFDPNFATALKIYFDDFFLKYKVFERLISQLDLFTSVLNSRFKFKKIEISREAGFLIKDSSIAGRNLPLNKLSSGEKQEILLFFDLIFNTNNDILLLVDEPELSLHVSWQQQFLDDLLKVIKMNNLQVIIATHSPQILGNHWDKQVDLGELYNGEELN
ncbi:MAG: AAA family ATPase [Oscillospiraceae bacterium]|nr:AAA family ATPase [Oscillospiraceae bacterium]